jgi:hypothetical protein
MDDVKELPVIRTVGIKYARRMHRDDGEYPVVAVLWEDGAISSIAFKDKDIACEHTEMNGSQEAYFAWIAHLATKGYKEVPIEVEGEVTETEGLIERVH